MPGRKMGETGDAKSVLVRADKVSGYKRNYGSLRFILLELCKTLS